MSIEDFRKLLNKYKIFRNLSDIYKTDKFLLLYLKIYEYMLSISKDEIVYTKIKTNIIYYGLLYYIEHFLKAKDFYNWRYRVYELMTKKIHNITIKKYELLYNSKAKEYWNVYTNKIVETGKKTKYEKYSVTSFSQTDEFREKFQNTWSKKRHNKSYLISLIQKNKLFMNFKDLYKTNKFINFIIKIYEYAINIQYKPKMMTKVLKYINYFLKAKDFNNWRNRIYTLLTEKNGATSFKMYKLLYNSKAEEYFSETVLKRKSSVVKSCNLKWNVDNVFQLEEVKEKSKKRNLERHGKECYTQTDEYKEKSKETSIKNWGTEYPMQSKEVQEKSKKTSMKNWGTEYPTQSKEFREKYKSTMMERWGVTHNFKLIQHQAHSKIADEFCSRLYDRLPDDMKPYCTFFKISNKEYWLRDKDKFYRYDFTFIREGDKIIVEFDGIYWHGLKEGQKFVRNIPVEEVWKYDLEKQKLAESMGFTVIRVREDEYKEDKDKCIERVLNDIFKVL